MQFGERLLPANFVSYAFLAKWRPNIINFGDDIFITKKGRLKELGT